MAYVKSELLLAGQSPLPGLPETGPQLRPKRFTYVTPVGSTLLDCMESDLWFCANQYGVHTSEGDACIEAARERCLSKGHAVGAVENPRAVLAAILVGSGLVLAVGVVAAVSSRKGK